jgi:hypothetical protein
MIDNDLGMLTQNGAQQRRRADAAPLRGDGGASTSSGGGEAAQQHPHYAPAMAPLQVVDAGLM